MGLRKKSTTFNLTEPLFVDVNAEIASEPSASNLISISFYVLHVYGLGIVGETIKILRTDHEYQPIPIDNNHSFEKLSKIIITDFIGNRKFM